MKQIKTRDKALRVINSCKTNEQLNIAFNYVKLYNKMYEDKLGTSMLIRVIEKKINGGNG